MAGLFRCLSGNCGRSSSIMFFAAPKAGVLVTEPDKIPTVFSIPKSVFRNMMKANEVLRRIPLAARILYFSP